MNRIEYYTAKLACETDVWDLSETLNPGENVVVTDVRTSNVFEMEHIPSAINIPHRTKEECTSSSTFRVDRWRAEKRDLC